MPKTSRFFSDYFLNFVLKETSVPCLQSLTCKWHFNKPMVFFQYFIK